jgi:hypothetical protein
MMDRETETVINKLMSDLKAAQDMSAYLAENNKKLRETLRLIAEHPVEQSQQWETAAKEMIRLAVAATKDVK